jgi:hypothetical protein
MYVNVSPKDPSLLGDPTSLINEWVKISYGRYCARLIKNAVLDSFVGCSSCNIAIQLLAVKYEAI